MEENKKKKKKLTPKWLVIKLSGICFAAYAVYYLRMLITYGGEMETKGIVVTALVAWLFGILSVFAWSSEARNSQMAAIRRMVLIVALAGIFALRTCMIGQVIGFLDPDKPYTFITTILLRRVSATPAAIPKPSTTRAPPLRRQERAARICSPTSSPSMPADGS